MESRHPETRQAWVEIDTSALKANLKTIRGRVGQHSVICAVVKADAYGHGAIEVAKLMVAGGAGCLAVATVDEGFELREAGLLSTPILVLSEPPISAVPRLLEYHITPTVTSKDFALALGETAAAANQVAPFHLKVNTGMNRIGIHYSEVQEFLAGISFHRGLRHEGTFTHFATADTSEDWDFKIQLNRFKEVIASLKGSGYNPGVVHCANSAAIVRYPDTYFDMVRPGIILYGLHPSHITYGRIDLKPAMSVHACVTHVKQPLLGEGVSYGLNYRCPGNVQIATIPLGYADGVHRCLTDRMEVLYRGHRVPQVGTICMDQMMFEVDSNKSILNPIPPVEIGEEVVLVGRQGDDLITLDLLAEKAGTINYELACSFGMRLPRVYV